MEYDLVSRPLVAELTFQGFDRSIHPELVESICVSAFERDGCRLVLRIIPAGHLMEWRISGLVLVEVLTEQASPLPENRQFFAHRLGGERSEQYFPTESISYQTCFQVEHLPAELFYHLHDELRHDGERGGVLHLFRPQDRLGVSPLSYVQVQGRPGSMIVHAYHTFPDEYAIVKTQTLVDFAV